MVVVSLPKKNAQQKQMTRKLTNDSKSSTYDKLNFKEESHGDFYLCETLSGKRGQTRIGIARLDSINFAMIDYKEFY